MQWVIALLGFVGGIGAASISAAIGVRNANRSMAADVRARWDAALLEKSSALIVAARSVRHLTERFGRVADEDAQRAKIDEAHERLRVLDAEIRLLGNRRVQEAARDVRYHAYSVRVFGEEGRDPRADSHPGRAPIERLSDSLQEFQRAVRVQLQAPDPEDVLHDDIDQLHPGLKPLSRKKRSKVA